MSRARLTKGEFTSRAVAVHGDLYDYSGTIYKTVRHKILVRCKSCKKDFAQFAYNHLSGHGCSRCRASKGEHRVMMALDRLGISYIREATFLGCKNVAPLRFDFFLPELLILIEYDGIQHRQPVERFGGVKAFEKTVRRDSIKNSFADSMDINLVRINCTRFLDFEVGAEIVSQIFEDSKENRFGLLFGRQSCTSTHNLSHQEL